MFPYTFPAVAALSVLLFALFGSGYYADWLRNWTATNLGPAFLKWAGYFAALMVSSRLASTTVKCNGTFA